MVAPEVAERAVGDGGGASVEKRKGKDEDAERGWNGQRDEPFR